METYCDRHDVYYGDGFPEFCPKCSKDDELFARKQGALEALRDACGEIESIAWASLTSHPQLDPALRMQAEIQRRMKRRIEALEKQEESDANAGS